MTYRMYLKASRDVYYPVAIATSEREAEIIQSLGHKQISRQEYVQIATEAGLPIPDLLPEEAPEQMALF